MNNPFQLPTFAITDDYLDISVNGFSKNINCIDFSGYTVGHLMIAEKKMFSSDDEALIILLQRSLCEFQEWYDEQYSFKNISVDDVRNFTQHYLIPDYGDRQLFPFSVEEFLEKYHATNDSWRYVRNNKSPVDELTKLKRLEQEEILKSFYFDKNAYTQLFFAISQMNYILYSWDLM